MPNPTTCWCIQRHLQGSQHGLAWTSSNKGLSHSLRQGVHRAWPMIAGRLWCHQSWCRKRAVERNRRAGRWGWLAAAAPAVVALTLQRRLSLYRLTLIEHITVSASRALVRHRHVHRLVARPIVQTRTDCQCLCALTATALGTRMAFCSNTSGAGQLPPGNARRACHAVLLDAAGAVAAQRLHMDDG